MIVEIPAESIKSHAEFDAMKKDINSILDRLHSMRVTRDVYEQIVAGIRHIAHMALKDKEVIEEIVDKSQTALRNKKELEFPVIYEEVK